MVNIFCPKYLIHSEGNLVINEEPIYNNPIADMLENDKNLIMKVWLQNVRAEVSAAKDKSDKEIINHIGRYFDTLVSALRNPHWNEVVIKNKDVSKEHGSQRFQLPDYTLDQIISEYHIFRKSVFDYLSAKSANPSRDDLKVINAFIDKGIEEASVEFVRLETEISELASKQNSLLEAASEYMWLVDREHRYLYINKALCDLWNMKLEEVIGTTVLERLHDVKLAQKINYEIEECFKGERIVGEALYINNEGEKGFYRYIISPVFAKDGSIKAAAGISRDNTKQKKMEIQLIDEQRKLSESASELETALKERDESLRTLSIVNRVGQDLTSKLNIEEIVQTVTDAATDLSEANFGAFFYSVKDESGKKYLLYAVSGVPREMFSQFPNPRSTEVFKQTFDGLGTLRSDDITLDPRFGKNAPYYGLPLGHLPVKSYLGVSVFSRSGEVLGGLLFGHKEAGVFTKQDEEIIEGLAAQAGIAMDNAKLYQNLQDSIKARDAFLSIASHELKTPLTSLTLQSQMRKRQLLKGKTEAFSLEKLQSMFEADVNQLGRLNRLIDDMLDISRMRMGKLSLKKERIDLNVLSREVVERFRPQLEEICKIISFDTSGEVWIDADPYRLEQVIANLLTNAMKYGEGKPLEIKVQANETIKKAYFCVSDKGMGISIEDQKRIFTRFERAVSPNDVSGLGLGLAIAKDIVEAHGGEIHLESEVGVGSTFSVELPLN